MTMYRNVMLAAVIGTLLTGCATQPPATVNGLKAVFHDPGFAVQGKTRKDQVWVSSTQETGIRVLGWARPKGVAGKKVVLVKSSRPAQAVKLPQARPSTDILPPTPRSEASPVAPAKRTTMQKLQDRIDALNEKVRKLEGR